ncbi:MAG: 2OG-Fe(II) oxygenase [Nitrospira sp.]|nr:2OG-Fe(II) oxygenase [Nitrospira sp.]MDE0486318.1 2OG-Fe(II) oxygenase [Nitrospira sp.]
MYEDLIRSLAKVDRPGDVSAAGDLPMTMPGLEVEGVGTLRLPLAEIQARALIKRCRQAPYGKGTQTLVDTDVRRVWEMDPARFELINPKWELLIESLLHEVQQRLGLEERKLSAHLYKLLVYEKGSFFLPHRDGEKLDGMVATLIVALPSVHEGGELVIRHEGRAHEIIFPGAASGLELSYAAFYADCQHEVKPLSGGYRLCLAYNVTLTKSSGRPGLNAPSYGTVGAKVAQLLGAWREKGETEKLAVTLEHRYTRDGLTLNKLKGVDRARAEVLFEAAEQAGCVAHLALVTLWQYGAVEYGEDDYFHQGRRYYYRRDDNDAVEGDIDSEHEMSEIFETSLTANDWSDRHGDTCRFGRMELDDGEIVAAAFDTNNPSEEELQGYTGNEGITLARWYHRAAVLIWPREHHFSVLCRAGTEAAIGGLEAMVKALKRASGMQWAAQRMDCLKFAGAIIDNWVLPCSGWFDDSNGETDRSVFLKLLGTLDDPDLMRLFLSEVAPNDGGIKFPREFVKFCKRQGLAGFEAELAQVIGAVTEITLLRNAELLSLLCRQPDNDVDDLALCTRLCERAALSLERFDDQAPDVQVAVRFDRPATLSLEWVDSQALEDQRQAQKLDRTALLCALVSAMLDVDAEGPLRKVLEHALARRDKYELTRTHLAAIFKLDSRLGTRSSPSEAIARWLSTCRRELQERTAQAPQPPTDYRRADALSCHCADCQVLSRFLGNPVERECRMPLNKERRMHLHRIIDGNRCDLTHVTERRDRPYTLVCRKTTASYERACATFERDKHNLSRLTGIEQRLG